MLKHFLDSKFVNEEHIVNMVFCALMFISSLLSRQNIHIFQLYTVTASTTLISENKHCIG